MIHINRFNTSLLFKSHFLSIKRSNVRAFTSKTEDTSEPRKDHLRKLFKSSRDVDDDYLIATELNGLGSSISALCWHKGQFNRNDEDLVVNEEDEIKFVDSSELNSIEREINHLLSVERNERERIRLLLEKKGVLQAHLPTKHPPSTMKLLNIASEISNRRPSSGKPQLDIERSRRDYYYHKQLNDEDVNIAFVNKCYKSRSYKTRESIRVLDVDRLPLPILHHMICYTLVKHMPAEVVLKVISRLALFRDKNNMVSYQHLFKHISYISSPICRAELVAFLSRGYQSISIPFMVDYVRKFGTFSRSYIANLIEKHSRPLPFDMFRYKSTQRNISNVLTRPWALSTFVNLLRNSSAKRYMYLNLLQFGYIPNLTKFDSYHSFGTLDKNIANRILASEKLLNISDAITNVNHEDEHRPEEYDDIIESYYTNIPLDIHKASSTVHFPREGSKENTMQYDPIHSPDAFLSPTSTQNIKLISDDITVKSHKSSDETRFYEIDSVIPRDRQHISWSVPWGIKRNKFHYRGKSYKLDEDRGWIRIKSPVRINYYKNVQMNKRKRLRKSIRKYAAKLARVRVINKM